MSDPCLWHLISATSDLGFDLVSLSESLRKQSLLSSLNKFMSWRTIYLLWQFYDSEQWAFLVVPYFGSSFPLTLINKNIQCGSLNTAETEVMRCSPAAKPPGSHDLSFKWRAENETPTSPLFCIQMGSGIQCMKVASPAAALLSLPFYTVAKYKIIQFSLWARRASNPHKDPSQGGEWGPRPTSASGPQSLGIGALPWNYYFLRDRAPPAPHKGTIFSIRLFLVPHCPTGVCFPWLICTETGIFLSFAQRQPHKQQVGLQTWCKFLEKQ